MRPPSSREGFAEERADEMRLQAARLGSLHLLADRSDGVWVHPLRGQLALGDELLDGVNIDRAINFAEKLGLLLRAVAVADSIDQQIAQSMALEQFAEHVIDFAAKGGPRFFKFFEQAAIDLALSRVGGAEIPRWQTSVWPMRWIRPNRCSSRLGFQGKS